MRLCKLALVFGVVALVAGPALAQPGRGGFRMGGAMLLRVEKVQKDLDLSKDQIKKADEALTKSMEDNRENFQKLFDPNVSQEDKDAIRKKMTEANEKMVKDILEEKQQKRLKQIERQQQGIDMFQDAAVVKALKISDKQKDQIKEINEEMTKEVAELFKDGFSREKLAKVQTMRKEALEKTVKVLDDDQKKALKDLNGKPLELKPEDFPRPTKPAKPRDF
jgi:hypothetical protein